MGKSFSVGVDGRVGDSWPSGLLHWRRDADGVVGERWGGVVFVCKMMLTMGSLHRAVDRVICCSRNKHLVQAFFFFFEGGGRHKEGWVRYLATPCKDRTESGEVASPLKERSIFATGTGVGDIFLLLSFDMQREC